MTAHPTIEQAVKALEEAERLTHYMPSKQYGEDLKKRLGDASESLRAMQQEPSTDHLRPATEWIEELFFDEDSEEQRLHVIDVVERIQANAVTSGRSPVSKTDEELARELVRNLMQCMGFDFAANGEYPIATFKKTDVAFSHITQAFAAIRKKARDEEAQARMRLYGIIGELEAKLNGNIR